MVIKKVISEKITAFDFYLDITKSNLLSCLCTECGLEEIFVEIYTIDKNKISFSQVLLQLGFNLVSIPYKNGSQDVAIKMNVSQLSIFASKLSEYDFEELTVWNVDKRWEQHLFFKSARGKIAVEDESNLYLCYNHAEKAVELYLNPCYDVEKIEKLIKKYIKQM